MSDEKFLINNLTDILSPRGLNKLKSTVGPVSIQDQIRQMIVEEPKKYSEIEVVIKNYYKKKDGSTPPEPMDDFTKGFHILSKKKGPLTEGEYKDLEYWKQGSNLDAATAIWQGIYGDKFDNEVKCEVCVIVARDPYMTPADAKTEDIEIFLNYMPSVVANQMIPYLDVEMAINRATKIRGAADAKAALNQAQSFADGAQKSLSSPSLLRFLLGSVGDTGSGGFTEADKALIRIKNANYNAIQFKRVQKASQTTKLDELKKRLAEEEKKQKTTEVNAEIQSLKRAIEKQEAAAKRAADQDSANSATAGGDISLDILSGMEMFLAPQSLTNMETLKSSKSRLMQVKPFLPFASILNFDVTVMNAGAGAMAHKTAKLQIKVHDKARIAEFAEFIKGPAGYATARIWTSYGWLCPRFIGQDDEYAELVNDKMHMKDCWTVRNTQFTIDATGSVVLNLDLISFAVSSSKKTSIKLQSNSYESAVRGFEQLMEEIEELSRPIKDTPLGPDARITQILNAGAQGNMLPTDIKQPAELIESVVSQYIKTGQLSEEDGKGLIDRLAVVLDPEAGKLQLAGVRSTSITGLLNDVVSGHDPFIPKILEAPKPAPAKKGAPTPKAAPPPQAESEPAKPNTDYFNERYISELNLFINPTPPPPVDPKAKKGKPAEPAKDKPPETPPRPEIKTASKVVSFGKLFTKLALPAILNANEIIKNDIDSEVQIIFYTLNDECGPVSGQSIAEFPIDVQRLAYAIDDLLSTKNKYDFTVDEFLRVVINNQFNDDRSIGYGMLSKGLFKPFDKEKTGPESAEKNQAYETSMAAWQAENAGFRKPMIEMFIETSRAGRNTAQRIHDILDAHKPEQILKDPHSVLRVHVYDKQNNPRKMFTQIIEASEGFTMGTLNDKAVHAALRQAAIREKNSDNINDKDPQSVASAAARAVAAINLKQKAIEAAAAAVAADPNGARKAIADLEKELGVPPGTLLKTPTGDFVAKIDKQLFGPTGIRAQLSKFAPTLDIGSNGTLIKSAQLQSKTDDLMAAANLVNIMKPKQGNAAGSTTAPATGLEGPGGLPIRTVPAQLTMTSVGCPALRLYQQFFVDLGTGTSLDNLYQVTQINHKISPGKFETTLNFMYTNGYGKFTAPPTVQSFLKKSGETAKRLQEEFTPKEPQKKGTSPATPPSTSAPATKPAPAGKP